MPRSNGLPNVWEKKKYADCIRILKHDEFWRHYCLPAITREEARSFLLQFKGWTKERLDRMDIEV